MLTNDLQLVGMWVAERVQCDVSHKSAAIGLLRDDKVVAGVLYDHFTGTSVVGTIAVEPGTILVKSFLHAIFDYPFNQLGVKTILAYAEEANVRSTRTLRKMGFKKHTSIPNVYDTGAMEIYTMNKSACRWLEI